MTIRTTVHEPAAARQAFAEAVNNTWGTGEHATMTVEKVCGSPAIWHVNIEPVRSVGPDLSCAACGMAAHRIATRCPATPVL